MAATRSRVLPVDAPTDLLYQSFHEPPLDEIEPRRRSSDVKWH